MAQTRMEDKLPTDRQPTTRVMARPTDTNGAGDIFGGWLLAQMDLAAGSYAIMRAGGRVATVGIEAMSFHRPVYVGDQVSCFCRTQALGNTSITVHVETWARRRLGHFGEIVKVTQGSFTFVALNEDGTKRRVPRDAE